MKWWFIYTRIYATFHNRAIGTYTHSGWTSITNMVINVFKPQWCSMTTRLLTNGRVWKARQSFGGLNRSTIHASLSVARYTLINITDGKNFAHKVFRGCMVCFRNFGDVKPHWCNWDNLKMWLSVLEVYVWFREGVGACPLNDIITIFLHVCYRPNAASGGWSCGCVTLSRDPIEKRNESRAHNNCKFATCLSNPEVLFKALTLLVNLLYIFIYAYAPLP